MDTNEPTETITLTLHAGTVRKIRSQVASGRYSTAEDLVEESISRMEALNTGLDQWIATEGVRRLRDMEENPDRALSHEEFWSQVESEMQAEDKDHSREAA